MHRTALLDRTVRIVRVFAPVLFAGVTLAGAQTPTGDLYGEVVDTEDTPLAEARLVLSGGGADRVSESGDQGRFHFLNLDPGEYTLLAQREGHATLEYSEIEVRVGRNTTLRVVLQPTQTETLTVTSESPLLDERELTQGTTVTRAELDTIPTARDPWAILPQTPGVLTSSINVGGSESGQQAIFTALGTGFAQNDWLLDGIQITDVTAGGGPPTYYDFDQFAEIQITTGGTDLTKNTAGVSVHLVTKRGTNEFRGSARFYNTKGGGYFGGALEQADPDVSQADMGPGQSLDDYGGRTIREIEDLGFEAGGAALRDRLWLWGSWGQSDIGIDLPSGADDDTVIESASVKGNAQITPANSAVVSWNNGNKTVVGRGGGVTRPPETTIDQRGPSAIYRFEDSHVVSSDVFVTGTYSIVDGGFRQAARGGAGPGAPESWRDASGVWHDNFASRFVSRPSDEIKLDSSWFFTTGSVSHELRVGGRYRSFEDSGATTWPGRDIFTFNTTSTHFVVAKRGIATPVENDYTSLWVQDTVTLGRLTLNAGLRYDRQEGSNEAATVPANPLVPTVLPAISYAGDDAPFDWTDVSPRLGLTWALGPERQTLIRASLSQFADQLTLLDVRRTNPTSSAYAYFVLPYEDAPYTGTGEELDDPSRVAFAFGFDPSDPTRLDSPNRTDPSLDAPTTTEILASVEHAVLTELVVGVTATWRQIDDVLEEAPIVRLPDGTERPVVASDYVPDGRLEGEILGGISGGSGGPYGVPVFALRDGLALTGGSLLTNGPREREYLGAALTVTKRLSDQWMARGYLNWGEAEWQVPASYLASTDPNRDRLGVRDGELFVQGAGGVRGDRFLQSSWSANLNGLYQVAPTRPWGFNLAANFTAREGYVLPYSRSTRTSDGVGRFVVVVDDFDDYRLDDVFVLDLRVEKELNLQGPMNLTFGIDAFNITNEGTEQSRAIDLGSANTYWLLDNLSARVFRLGVRLSWR